MRVVRVEFRFLSRRKIYARSSSIKIRVEKMMHLSVVVVMFSSLVFEKHQIRNRLFGITFRQKSEKNIRRMSFQFYLAAISCERFEKVFSGRSRMVDDDGFIPDDEGTATSPFDAS